MNAADVLTAILFARDHGQEPALILDENSPLVDAAREVLKPRAPPAGDTAELERNWLIQTGMLTPIQADKSVSLSQAITPSEVMQAYRRGARGLEKANAQAENFERLYYLMLQTLEDLLDTSEALSNYAWSAVRCDCDDARVYLQELLDSLRLEIKTVRTALESAEGKLSCRQGQHPDYPCRSDGRCQYAIDLGAEGMGHCPRGKCATPPIKRAEDMEPGDLGLSYWPC